MDELWRSGALSIEKAPLEATEAADTRGVLGRPSVDWLAFWLVAVLFVMFLLQCAC